MKYLDRKMEQRLIAGENCYKEIDEWMQGKKNIFLVCSRHSIQYLSAFYAHLKRMEKSGIQITAFHDFAPNPTYDSVVEGVRQFRAAHCDSIIAAGGGSAIDVAKCIKLYHGMDGDGRDGDYLNRKPEVCDIDIPFLVLPTTAGSGSEATQYAVIYYEGVKQSITDERIVPDTVLLDSDVLKTLPVYQKKASMMDAFSHALESLWSVNSTVKSKEYSKAAIKGILANMDGYLSNTKEGNAGMLMAAHAAGKAINITQTTAGHAMCYKLTGLYQIEHGHAAILCNRILFPWTIKNVDQCIDSRGREYLRSTLDEIGQAMGCSDAAAGAIRLLEIFNRLEFEIPAAAKSDYIELINSVNPVRLKNHPVAMDTETIRSLYHEILR